eukprot:214289-Pleurochrysis_carterae.AAC.1
MLCVKSFSDVPHSCIAGRVRRSQTPNGRRSSRRWLRLPDERHLLDLRGHRSGASVPLAARRTDAAAAAAHAAAAAQDEPPRLGLLLTRGARKLLSSLIYWALRQRALRLGFSPPPPHFIGAARER